MFGKTSHKRLWPRKAFHGSATIFTPAHSAAASRETHGDECRTIEGDPGSTEKNRGAAVTGAPVATLPFQTRDQGSYRRWPLFSGGSAMTRHLFYAITLMVTRVLLNSPADAATMRAFQCEDRAANCVSRCANFTGGAGGLQRAPEQMHGLLRPAR